MHNEGGFLKKGEVEFVTLFLPRFPEKEGSDYYENEACYAFNVIRRQQHAGWVNGCQYRIAKQDCSEHYHEQSKNQVLGFHEELFSAISPYNSLDRLRSAFFCLRGHFLSNM